MRVSTKRSARTQRLVLVCRECQVRMPKARSAHPWPVDHRAGLLEFGDRVGERGVEVAGKLSHPPRAAQNGIGRSGTTLEPLAPNF